MPGTCISSAVLGQGSSLKKANKMSALLVVAKEKADSGCESDSDSNYACEAPDFDEELARACSRPSGKQNCGTGVYSGKTDAGSSRFDNAVSLDSAGRPCKKRKTESLNPVNAATVNLTASKPCSATALRNSSHVPQVSKNNAVDSGPVDVCCDVHKADGEEAAHLEDNEKVTPSCSQDSIQPAGCVPGPTLNRISIWIVGHSYIELAAKHADTRPFGRLLGLDGRSSTVLWWGLGDMRWGQLLPTLAELSISRGCPDILVVHLGENDLVQLPGLALIKAIKADLLRLKTVWPGTHIVWTELVQKGVWKGAKNPAAIDKARRKINHEISGFCTTEGFGIIKHAEISYKNHALFRSGGDLLSFTGNERYLIGLRNVILESFDCLRG